MICVFITIGVIILVGGLAFFDTSMTILFCCWHILHFITIPLLPSINFNRNYILEHKESRQAAIPHKSVGSASARLALYGYCFLITVICKSFASIKFSCLHLGQKRGKFFNSVSCRICNLVLFPQIGQSNHFVFILQNPFLR